MISNLMAVIIFFVLSIGQAAPQYKAGLSMTMNMAALVLTAGSGIPGVITIQNSSPVITATNIRAQLPSSWTEVVQNATNCVSVAPLTSCQIQLTPGNVLRPTTNIIVKGTNTSSLTVTVQFIASPTLALITLTGSPLTLQTTGMGVINVFNDASSAVAATGIASDFTGTALFGNVTETGNTCANLMPGNSCTLTFTAGATLVPQTNFPINGTNMNSVTGAIAIQQLATTTPNNTVATVGQTAFFSTFTSGGSPPYTYQWQLNPAPGFPGFANIVGANASSYVTPILLITDNGNLYRVVVTDSKTVSVTSGAATLTVNAPAVVGTLLNCSSQGTYVSCNSDTAVVGPYLGCFNTNNCTGPVPKPPNAAPAGVSYMQWVGGTCTASDQFSYANNSIYLAVVLDNSSPMIQSRETTGYGVGSYSGCQVRLCTDINCTTITNTVTIM